MKKEDTKKRRWMSKAIKRNKKKKIGDMKE